MRNIESYPEITKGPVIGKCVRQPNIPVYYKTNEQPDSFKRGILSPSGKKIPNGICNGKRYVEDIYHGRRTLKSNKKTYSVYDGSKENCVFKKLDEIEGPIFQYDNPMIEKIIINKKKFYFAYLDNESENKKLVTYTVFNEDGKKKLNVHNIIKVKPDVILTRDMLKKYAIRTIESSKFYKDLTKRKNIVDVHYPAFRESCKTLPLAA